MEINMYCVVCQLQVSYDFFFAHIQTEQGHSCDIMPFCFPFSHSTLMHATMHQLPAQLD